MTIRTLFLAEAGCSVDVFGHGQSISLNAGDAILWDSEDGSLYSFKKQRLETPVGGTQNEDGSWQTDGAGRLLLTQPIVRVR